MYKGKYVSAVIVAAGNSSRMRSSVSKQLMTIGGKTVIENTADKFVRCEYIDEIVVVCPKGDEDFYSELLGDGIIVTGGGAARQQSVYNGVTMTKNNCDIIVIHDGARPLVDILDIKKVIIDAEKYGASTLAVPVKDTIKIVENNKVIDTPNRESLYAVQTPQVFCKGDYLMAYERALNDNVEFTDDCRLIEYVGGSVHITIGNYTNIKITTPEDIEIAETLLKRSGNV